VVCSIVARIGSIIHNDVGVAMATWDSIDRYLIISTDTHAGADLHDYKPYLPVRLHDEFDRWAATYDSPFDDLIIATA
jgi:hypothetical protein